MIHFKKCYRRARCWDISSNLFEDVESNQTTFYYKQIRWASTQSMNCLSWTDYRKILHHRRLISCSLIQIRCQNIKIQSKLHIFLWRTLYYVCTYEWEMKWTIYKLAVKELYFVRYQIKPLCGTKTNSSILTAITMSIST